MKSAAVACCLLICVSILPAQQYDLVLANGRVMDTETNLDAVRNARPSRSAGSAGQRAVGGS